MNTSQWEWNEQNFLIKETYEKLDVTLLKVPPLIVQWEHRSGKSNQWESLTRRLACQVWRESSPWWRVWPGPIGSGSLYRPMRARIREKLPMGITDLEAGMSGVKRILPLMKGLTWPHKKQIPLSPNGRMDQGIVTNENHWPGGWRVGCEENLAPDKGLDLPHRKRIPLSPNVSTDQGIVSNENHWPGGWSVGCAENPAPDESLDLARQEANPLVAQWAHGSGNSNQWESLTWRLASQVCPSRRVCPGLTRRGSPCRPISAGIRE